MPKQSKLFLFALIIFSACNNYTDKDKQKDIKSILEINKLQQKAHMTNDAALLASTIADTMLTVSNGNVYKNSNKEIYERFNQYFKSVKYIKWDDVEDPIVKISSDGSLAELIVKKIVVVTDPQNQSDQDATLFSWSAGLKKINGKWKNFSNASTREDLDFASYKKYLEEAGKSLIEKDYRNYLFNLERAHYLAMERASVTFQYAKALTLNENYAEALKHLNQLADKNYEGLKSLEDDPAFLPREKLPEYDNLIKKFGND